MRLLEAEGIQHVAAPVAFAVVVADYMVRRLTEGAVCLEIIAFAHDVVHHVAELDREISLLRIGPAKDPVKPLTAAVRPVAGGVMDVGERAETHPSGPGRSETGD